MPIRAEVVTVAGAATAVEAVTVVWVVVVVVVVVAGIIIIHETCVLPCTQNFQYSQDTKNIQTNPSTIKKIST